MSRRIICIVEGQGERAAVPTLVNRMLKHLGRDRTLAADPEYVLCTKNGDRITEPHDPERQLGIEYYVARAARENPGGILVVVDAEDRCVKRAGGAPPLGPSLRSRAQPIAGEIPLGVVVANRMFEAWFLADFHSLRSRGKLLMTSKLPEWREPETLGGCKGVMTDLLGAKYKETGHQPDLAHHVSLPLRKAIQRRSRSYVKLFREVDELSRQARQRL